MTGAGKNGRSPVDVPFPRTLGELLACLFGAALPVVLVVWWWLR